MAAAGNSYTTMFSTQRTQEETTSAFLMGLSGTADYTVNMAGNNTVILTRRYLPTWAIVVAIIGAFFFLIGLLLLLVRTTETLTINVTGAGGTTAVTVSGVASIEMASRLNAVIGSLQPVTAPPVPPGPPAPPALA